MRRGEVEQRPARDDPARVQMSVGAVIVGLDVVHVHGRGDTGHLMELAQIVREIWVVDDAAQVAFEMDVVDRIEADQCREQPPVRLGDDRAREIALV